MKVLDVIISICILIVVLLLAFVPERDIVSMCSEDNCFLDLAMDSLDSDYCLYTSNESQCYFTMAIKLNQSNLCENEIDPQSCLKSFAATNQDLGICLDFQNDSKLECLLSYAVFNGDLSACDYAEDQYFCIYSYAIHKKDSILCEMTFTYKDECKERIENATEK